MKARILDTKDYTNKLRSETEYILSRIGNTYNVLKVYQSSVNGKLYLLDMETCIMFWAESEVTIVNEDTNG